MSETIVPAAEEGVVPGGRALNPRAAFRSVALSIFVNGVLPFATYKILAPHYQPGSIWPLLYASAFPVLGLFAGLIRTRSVDAIAAFALFGLAYSIAATFLAGEVHRALIFGATQGFLIAAFFFLSALAGRPVIFFIVRQFVAGNDVAERARFAAVNEADGGRTFFTATMVWAAGTALLSTASLALALLMQPAAYLLVNSVINTAVNIGLVIWTIRFVRGRLEPRARG